MTEALQKTPLVLIPGLLLTGDMWAHQTRHLGDLADITIADTLRDQSIEAMADRLLVAAPARFALAGLSMGGYVALSVMRKAPERVTKLALMDTQARPDSEESKRKRRGLLSLSKRGEFKGVTPRLLPMLVHEDRLGDQSLIDAIMAMAAAVGQEGFARQQQAIMDRVDSRDILGGIEVPTLVLCGRQDALTPLPLHEEMAAIIPTARLAIIEDCGHLPAMERPQAVTALMRDCLVYDR
jgi:pimeloyl-ACP methyl ester carboxylesterase